MSEFLRLLDLKLTHASKILAKYWQFALVYTISCADVNVSRGCWNKHQL